MRFLALRSMSRIRYCDYTVILNEYEKLSPEEKQHFAKCSKCGEIFDRRSLDEVMFHHADHKHRPDIQYSRSTSL